MSICKKKKRLKISLVSKRRKQSPEKSYNTFIPSILYLKKEFSMQERQVFKHKATQTLLTSNDLDSMINGLPVKSVDFIEKAQEKMPDKSNIFEIVINPEEQKHLLEDIESRKIEQSTSIQLLSKALVHSKELSIQQEDLNKEGELPVIYVIIC